MDNVRRHRVARPPVATRSRGDRHQARHRSDDGFGLLEAIIAFAILAIVLAPIMYVVMAALQDSGKSRTQTAALTVAEKWLETLNNSGPTYQDSIPKVGIPIQEGTTVTHTKTTPTTANATSVHYTTVAGVKYYTIGRFTWALPSGKPDVCTSGQIPPLLRLTVAVRWGTQSISDTTMTDYPPTGLPKYGFIGVQIERSPTAPTKLTEPVSFSGVDWGGQNTQTGRTRVHTIPVTVTRTPSTRTLYPTTPTTSFTPTVTHPTTDGCAFLEVPPGHYQVKVGPETSETPFVEPGTTNYQTPVYYPTGTLTVAVDKVTATDFRYDEGAYVRASYPDTTIVDEGVTCSTSAQLCIASGQSAQGSSPDGSTGTAATVSVLSTSPQGDTSWSDVHALTTTTTPSVTKVEISGIDAMTCTGTLCIAVGYGPTGAAAVVHQVSAAATDWSPSTLPPGVADLSEVTCPTSSVCVAVGSGTSGGAVVVSGTVAGGSVTWKLDSLSGVSSLSEVTCPSSSACVAVGSGTSGGAVVVSGAASGGTWSPDSLSGVSSLSEVTCPSSSACVAVGSGTSGGAVVVSGAASGGTWSPDSLSGVSSLSEVTCPSSSACVAVGSGTSGGAVVVSGTVAGGSVTWKLDSLSGVSSLSEVTCPSSSACVAVGSGTSGGAVVVSGAASGGTWSTDSLSGVSSLSEVTCPTSSVCVAVGSGTSGGAVVLTGTVAGGSVTWKPDTFNGPSPTFLFEAACFTASTPTRPLVCGATGATDTGALLLDDPTTGAGGTRWASTRPATPAPDGIVSGGLAVSVSSGGTQPVFVACTASSSTLCTTIGPVFPFEAGYAIGAGTCTTELSTVPVHVNSVPGTTLSDADSGQVTLPLATLALKVVNAEGLPVNDATVTAKVHDPAHATCTTLVLSLGTTGADGTLTTALMSETYTVTITAGVAGSAAGKRLMVSATSVSWTAVTYPLPSPVVVTL